MGTTSTQNVSNEGGSPLTADEAHDENFRRMLDKYYCEVEDPKQAGGAGDSLRESSAEKSNDDKSV